jgi:uncharacterized protein YegP (UPF0339 family)
MAEAKALKAEIFRSPDGWRYRVKAKNGKVIDKAEQGFSNKGYMIRVRLIQRHGLTRSDIFEVAK